VSNFYKFLYAAEEQLFSSEKQQPNFPIALLKLIANESIDLQIRFAAALFFKNYVKRNWFEVIIQSELITCVSTVDLIK
jgi:exportin-2 (importin alpha re-exporter)